MRPIVTPYELQVGLQDEPVWDGQYRLDFHNFMILSGNDEIKSNDLPHFSTISGKLVNPRSYVDQGDENDLTEQPISDNISSALIKAPGEQLQQVLFSSAGANFLANKTFKGLGSDISMDDLNTNSPSILEEGRSGIARGYVNETDNR